MDGWKENSAGGGRNNNVQITTTNRAGADQTGVPAKHSQTETKGLRTAEMGWMLPMCVALAVRIREKLLSYKPLWLLWRLLKLPPSACFPNPAHPAGISCVCPWRLGGDPSFWTVSSPHS